MSTLGAEIVVRGHVQGVGFRYFCHTRAVSLQLTGWVKNMPSGSVALYVEGEKGSISALVDDLEIGPSASSVADVAVHWLDYSGKYQSFSITG